MLQLKVLFWTNTFLAGQTNTNIKPATLCHMTCKRVSVLSESSLMKLKCNSRTNTTLTLTNFFCPLCTPRSTGDTSTTPGPSALDVGCHCLPTLKTPDEPPVVLDVSAQDGQKELQDATLFCRVPLQLTNFWRPLQIQS